MTNLVVNSGAESLYSGWSNLATYSGEGWRVTANPAWIYEGSYGFYTAYNGNGGLSFKPMNQSLTFTPGTNYKISFFGKADTVSTATVTIKMNGNAVLFVNAIAPTTFTQYKTIYTATNVTEILEILGDARGSFLMIDNINVSPTNETASPSAFPTLSPTLIPTAVPTTRTPTLQPSIAPTRAPTFVPTVQPSSQPSGQPTKQPMVQPTLQPSVQPTSQPSVQPSGQPTMQLTEQPTAQPTSQPSLEPSAVPTVVPTVQPSSQPSGQPTKQPMVQPTLQPTVQPTSQPSVQPSGMPTEQPTGQPTSQPTTQPSGMPTEQPTGRPISQPSAQPSVQPSVQPTSQPNVQPTGQPTSQPTTQPSGMPSMQLSVQPTSQPSSQPSGQPTMQPREQPTAQPSSQPSLQPSVQPSVQPTVQPTSQPSVQPSVQPTVQPSVEPTAEPTAIPTAMPSTEPTVAPTVVPTIAPTTKPSAAPTIAPTVALTAAPTVAPTIMPTKAPSAIPSFISMGTLPSDQLISVIGTNNEFKMIMPFLHTNWLPGEGFANITISGPTSGVNYVIFGNNETSNIDLSSNSYRGEKGYSINNAISYDSTGRSASSIGDFNKDGHQDYIICTPARSACYVLFGKSSGFHNLNQGFTITGKGIDAIGWSVDGAGDINGDGYDDIILSAPYGNATAGVVYVIFGKESGFSDVDVDNMSIDQGFAIYGASKAEYVGVSVSKAGDINGDGYDDVIIGSLGMNNYYKGNAYVVFGKASGFSNIYLNNMSIDQGFTITGEESSGNGYSVSSAGDYNKDGYADVLIGATGVANMNGVSYLIFGKKDGFSNIYLASLSYPQGLVINGGGVSVTSIGDVNNDGNDDVMIGNWYASNGKSYVIFTPDKFSVSPSIAPTGTPSASPSIKPTFNPSIIPSIAPTEPTFNPSFMPSSPTYNPTAKPTAPTESPTTAPTVVPTVTPTAMPSVVPTIAQTVAPTMVPMAAPSAAPTAKPTAMPSVVPTAVPTKVPTMAPTTVPTMAPTTVPTLIPSADPTMVPTVVPTVAPEEESNLVLELVLGLGIPAAFITTGIWLYKKYYPVKIDPKVSNKIEPDLEIGEGSKIDHDTKPNTAESKFDSWFPYLFGGGKSAAVMPFSLRTADQELEYIAREAMNDALSFGRAMNIARQDSFGSLFDYNPEEDNGSSDITHSDEEIPPLVRDAEDLEAQQNADDGSVEYENYDYGDNNYGYGDNESVGSNGDYVGADGYLIGEENLSGDEYV